ncbi:MAG: hypothetical protein HBSAPP03_18700 [Phycisphaerae bacterium]|nr:MAG: hypothetical protein HBSAPP03_18700 [Phycisphaerae bacterium]
MNLTITSDERYPGLDALRVCAAVVVVATHASMAYLTTFPSAAMWPVHEPGSGVAADVFFLYSRGTAMQVFLATAGFLSAHAGARLGAEAFLRRRMIRLGAPFLVGLLVVVPLMYGMWLWGAWRTDSPRYEDVLEIRYDAMDATGLVGPAHLWYLEYLALYTVFLAWWLRRASIRRASPAKARGMRMVGVALLFGGALVGTHWLLPDLIADFRNAFLPSPVYFAYNGLFFALGVVLWRRRDVLARASRYAWPLLLVAHGSFALWIGAVWTDAIPEQWRPMVSACGAAFCSVCSVGGWLGLATRERSMSVGCRTWLRRAAEATLTIYVVHLPVVFAVHVALWRTPMPMTMKWLLATAAGVLGGIAAHRGLDMAREWVLTRRRGAEEAIVPPQPA